MTIHRSNFHKHAPANFDSIARFYRWMEYLGFGRSLERCRTHFLAQLASRRRALLLGEGDGRFTARLLADNPHLHADVVDTSAAMLHLLAHRADSVDARARLRTHHIDALAFEPDQAPGRKYDLIVTHFFLDCLTQPEVDNLACRLTCFARPNALWLFSDFRIPAGAMRWPARLLVRLLYLAFRMLTGLRTTALPDHAAALTTAGFTRIAQHHCLAGLISSEIWAQSLPAAAGGEAKV
jgi:hypothetical protein